MSRVFRLGKGGQKCSAHILHILWFLNRRRNDQYRGRGVFCSKRVVTSFPWARLINRSMIKWDRWFDRCLFLLLTSNWLLKADCSEIALHHADHVLGKDCLLGHVFYVMLFTEFSWAMSYKNLHGLTAPSMHPDEWIYDLEYINIPNWTKCINAPS